MEENWKTIEENDYYEVSNYGRVRSKDRYVKHPYGNMRIKGRIMKPFLNNGYLMVTLRRDGSKKNYKVHRLVAEAFLPNPEGLPCINHKDCDRTNAEANNLEWCTYFYNNHYRFLR